MKAKILACLGLDDYRPMDEHKEPDPTIFHVQMRMDVGFEGTDGKEFFYATVCSPTWLSAHAHTGDVAIGKRYILADYFDWPKIRTALDLYVDEHCAGRDVSEVVGKLQQIGFWDNEEPVFTATERSLVIEARNRVRGGSP